MKMMTVNGNISASFRDPSGFLFYHDKKLYRQINKVYKDNYQLLIDSGLYRSLTSDGLLIPHQEVDLSLASDNNAFKVVCPEPVPFISYPYEWSFSQLKDAALTTLNIQKKALEYGVSLKDASAYNIQFHRGKPVLIDTLSFEKFQEGEPWVAYKQFCQHFLAPLALMAYRDVRLSQLLRIYIDGIPLDLAGKLLPLSTRFNFSILTHIHLHAKSQQRFAGRNVKPKKGKISTFAIRGIIDSLLSAIKRLKWKPAGTEWADYYEDTNYSSDALAHKTKVISEYLDKLSPQIVWDLGANLGLFSRLASNRGIFTVAFDIDPSAVEKNYLRCRQDGETNLLPLLLDLTNPSPGIGWCNTERTSLLNRGPADTVLALALIHHLAISNNLPFSKISDFFRTICDSLIIEFIPKEDSQVQRLLSTREDIFPDYSQPEFESEFGKNFDIVNSQQITDSERILYLMRRKSN